METILVSAKSVEVENTPIDQLEQEGISKAIAKVKEVVHEQPRSVCIPVPQIDSYSLSYVAVSPSQASVSANSTAVRSPISFSFSAGPAALDDAHKVCPVAANAPSSAAVNPPISFSFSAGPAALDDAHKVCPVAANAPSSAAVRSDLSQHLSVNPNPQVSVANVSAPPISPRRLINANTSRYNSMRACLLDYWIENRGYNPDHYDGNDPLPFNMGLPSDLNPGDENFQRFLDNLIANGTCCPDSSLKADLEARGYVISVA